MPFENFCLFASDWLMQFEQHCTTKPPIIGKLATESLFVHNKHGTRTALVAIGANLRRESESDEREQSEEKRRRINNSNSKFSNQKKEVDKIIKLIFKIINHFT